MVQKRMGQNGIGTPVQKNGSKCTKKGMSVNMENYTFEDMYVDLRNGYQIYYTYVKNRYVLFKTAKNCYTQKLITDNPKNPHPRMTMLTLKRVKEIFPFMEDIEYKVGVYETENL